ncbi:MAG: HD-GYP domain-containing protein, partial [Planctomycetota bacterium]
YVLLPGASAQEASAVAQRVQKAMKDRTLDIGAVQMTLTLSMGVADLNAGGISSGDDLVAVADRAAYAAKTLGRDRVVLADDLPNLQRPEGKQEKKQVETLRNKLAGLNGQFKDVFISVVAKFAEALGQRDPYRLEHSHNVRRYARMIAKEMRLPDHMIQRIEIAALLHDIGMIALPDSVLLSQGALTDEQLDIMRRHPLLSVRIMEGMDFLEQEVPAVRHHHERFDGQGYPDGLAGPAIPLPARILAVADAFDAIGSPRAFRGARPLEEVLGEIQASAGTHFDPAVVNAFLSVAQREGDHLMPPPPADAEGAPVAADADPAATSGE